MNEIIPAMLQDLKNNIDDKDIRHYYFGNPETIPNEELVDGVIVIEPNSTTTQPVTTGIIDEDTNTLNLIIMRQVRGLPDNGQREPGASFMTRVVDGKDSNKVLLANTVRSVIRTHFRNYGIMQTGLDIKYDTNEKANDGVITTTITFGIVLHTNINLTT